MSTFQKIAAALPFVLLVACTDPNKAPAEAAMKAAGDAVATLGADASKYAPEGVAAVQKSYAAAKELLAKQDYKGTLDAASGIPAKVKDVLAAAAAKKEELVKAWTDASAKVAAMVPAIKSRVYGLQQQKGLPRGITKEVLAKVSDELASVEAGLAKLSEDFKGGKIDEAIAGAKALQAKCAEIMKSIGME
jgi:hypothetical protein